MNDARNILAPTDFSPASDVAVARAAAPALASEGELHLLHVMPSMPSALVPAESLGELSRHARERLGHCLPPQFDRAATAHRELRNGVPHREIVDYARDHAIDLIVMGTHGRTGLTHLALGSVAERVLRHAPCPVLVVPAKEESAAAAPDTESERTVSANEGTSGRPIHEASPALDLVARATAARATDIHIDPSGDDKFAVRFRIDGRLERYCELDPDIAEHLMHQLKTLAALNIADPLHAQEGRLRLPARFADLDVRITTAPVAGGEAVALRLFDREHVFRPLGELGFGESARGAVDRMLQRGEGLVLVTGPTGSGKTTTVYSMLESLQTTDRNIVSVEDPVEFAAPFIRQLDVDPRHGITMTSGLRTLLRMDPDILFLGEVRDVESAEIAMRAASSGKYVFTTLHTRDVAATVTALRDLGVDNRSLAGNLNGILSQRLVRRLCRVCSTRRATSDVEREAFLAHQIEPPAELAAPAGCPECRETGYRGRIGVFEVALADETLCEAIDGDASEETIRSFLLEAGVTPLTADVLIKARDGETSFDEARRMRWA